MKFFKLAIASVILASSVALAHAADLAGRWTSEFDSQIGPQKYTYDFKKDGDSFTGKATYEHSVAKGESVLKNIKLSGDEVSFIEEAHMRDMDLVITYSGKIAGDEMNLKRIVGDFATEQIVLKRARAGAEKPAAAK